MATDEKGLQRAGIAIRYGGMLGQLAKLPEGGRADPQQPAHLPRSVHSPVGQALGPEQGLELGLGQGSEIEGRIGTPDAGKTAGAPFRDAHRDDPLPRWLSDRSRAPGRSQGHSRPGRSHLTGLPIPLIPLPLRRR